jgi:hypothetical protein
MLREVISTARTTPAQLCPHLGCFQHLRRTHSSWYFHILNHRYLVIGWCETRVRLDGNHHTVYSSPSLRIFSFNLISLLMASGFPPPVCLCKETGRVVPFPYPGFHPFLGVPYWVGRGANDWNGENVSRPELLLVTEVPSD